MPGCDPVEVSVGAQTSRVAHHQIDCYDGNQRRKGRKTGDLRDQQPGGQQRQQTRQPQQRAPLAEPRDVLGPFDELVVAALGLSHEPALQHYLLAQLDQRSQLSHGCLPRLHGFNGCRVEYPPAQCRFADGGTRCVEQVLQRNCAQQIQISCGAGVDDSVRIANARQAGPRQRVPVARQPCGSLLVDARQQTGPLCGRPGAAVGDKGPDQANEGQPRQRKKRGRAVPQCQTNGAQRREDQ